MGNKKAYPPCFYLCLICENMLKTINLTLTNEAFFIQNRINRRIVTEDTSFLYSSVVVLQDPHNAHAHVKVSCRRIATMARGFRAQAGA